VAVPRRWLAVLGGATLVVLLMAWWLKSNCLAQPWGDGFEYRHFCYSDIQVQYVFRVNSGHDVPVPYSGLLGEPGFNEYPALTGLTMYLAAVLTDNIGAYMGVQAVLLGVLALATTAVLARLAPPKQVLWWAAAPGLFLYAFYSWDLLAVGFCVLGILAYRRERFLLSGALLGLGAAAKLYPAFLMPALGLALVARAGGRLDRSGWAFGGGFVAAWLAVNLPFMLAYFPGWWETYAWQMGRGPNLESPYFVLGHLGRHNGLGVFEPMGDEAAASVVAMLLFLGSLVVSGHLAATRRLEPLAAAAIPVFAFLAFNKVQSIQYVLWALPLLALLPLRDGQRAAVVAADVALFLALFTFFAVSPQVADTALYLPVGVAVIARCGAYTWILSGLVQKGYAHRPRNLAKAA
jgi:hypothetical protein